MLEDNEVFIHIGLPKTATSFFQKEIFPKISNLKLIVTPYTQYNKAFNSIQYADDTIYNEEEIKEQLCNLNQFKKILISEESFSGGVISLIAINRTQNAIRLKRLFPNARIILFLRGQESMLNSLYNQYIRAHSGTRRIGQFYRIPNANEFYLRKKNKNLLPQSSINFLPNHSHLELFKYFNLVKLYKSLFNNVDVFLYEDFKNNPMTTLTRLENIFQEKLNLIETGYFGKKINPSLNNLELQKQIFYNKTRFILRSKFVSNTFYFIYKLYYSNKFLLKEAEFIKNSIRNYYTEDNNKIIKEFSEIPLNKYPDFYEI